ncbi:ATP-binding cassette domain-containing protein [Arcobacteraceae bacterium]|nr:ATP-binding cassette domain-containing protein [Arcobacteraceae bacterium]
MAFYLENHTISYGEVDILNNINLSIKKGEKIALLGRSGSGKSTLLKNLFDLQKKNSSYIPQELGLINNLSVFHNIYMAHLDTNSTFYNIRNLIKPAKKELTIVNEILEKLFLNDKILSKVSQLSGGQKQRTAIARSLNDDKQILLADEPISALDENLSQVVMDNVKDKFQTVICALHNVDIALKNFDRVIGLNDGKIVLDKCSSEITSIDTTMLYNVCK